MQKKINYTLLHLLLYGIIFAGFLIYFSLLHGLFMGVYLTLLSWSLYILVIPGGHGQLLLGMPARFITAQPIYSEYFFWSGALLLNSVSVMAYPAIYGKSLLTYFFYQLLTNPNPGWLIFALSSLGTFYNAIFSLPYFGIKQKKHTIIRAILIFFGIVSFIYLSHQELIICMNILAQ